LNAFSTLKINMFTFITRISGNSEVF
jgi:hypothetical protein